jgi:hypothetical protein
MDLDLDMAFFDMNDMSFLDLMSSEFGREMTTPGEALPHPPKPPVTSVRPPGLWQMMTGSLATHDIDFNVYEEPQPQPLSEEFSLDQAASIMSTDVPETLPLPALSPPRSGTSPDVPVLDTIPGRSDNTPQICSCLASIYLALDSLQHLPTTVIGAINTARTASKTAYNTIDCPVCANPPLGPPNSNPPIQSLQNMMMLGALLPSLSNAYKTILRQVDEEAAAAALSFSKLTFDLVAFGGLWGSLADPDNLCGAVENVNGRDLEPGMWRLAVRSLLKIDVYGASTCMRVRKDLGGEKKQGEPLRQLGLKDIIQMMEQRSRRRHEEMDRLVREGGMEGHDACDYVPLENERGEKPTCLRIVDVAKRSLMSLDIP